MTTRPYLTDDPAELEHLKRAAHNFAAAVLNIGAQCVALGYLFKQLLPRLPVDEHGDC